MPTTQRSQPPTPGAHPAAATPPCPMRNLSEFAVADTPGTAWPEYGGAQNYFQARFVPIDTHDQPPPRPQASSRTPTHTHNQTPSQQQQQQEGGVPTALARGVPNGSGPTNAAERQATRYVEGEGGGQPGTKQNENVDAGPGQMEMYPEGRVADAVERNRRHQEEGGQMQQQQQQRRRRRESVSVGVSGGLAGLAAGMGNRTGPGGSAGRGASPAGQGLHGRGRGEVTLEKREADLERRKQQQAAARKQVMDARKRGEDVDGRGTTGPSGRQPRAETD